MVYLFAVFGICIGVWFAEWETRRKKDYFGSHPQRQLTPEVFSRDVIAYYHHSGRR